MTYLRPTRETAPSGYRRAVLRNLTPGQRHLVAFDVVVATALTGVMVFAALDAETSQTLREPVWLSWLAAVTIAGPIAVRRFWPLPALVVALSATVVSVLVGVIPVVAVGAPLSAVAVALYLVGRELTYRHSVLVLATCVVALIGSLLARRLVERTLDDWLDTVYGLAFAGLVLGVGWSIGATARVRAYWADQAMAQAASKAVAEERLRIARELHDIVAHSMSLIAVKAGIGNHVAESRPEQAREALRVIEETSRGSLAEMRHLLGALRSEVDGPVLAPTPGVTALPDLASRAADAGVSVSVEVGDGELPEGIGLSVYRIVQESVTNVVRHAAPTRCQVTVEPTGEDVRVEVINEGPVVRTTTLTGHGLIGMRERVAMYGGTFEAGPRPDGGFRVAATIPYGAA
jgi:signal transduction histidine kinase